MPPTARRRPGRPAATDSADTRGNIVAAARDVFRDVGYDAATFQEIAGRAGLTRPAINHYFADKQTLFREVLAEADRGVVAAGIERARQSTTLVDRLTAFLDTVVEIDADRSIAAFQVTAMLESRRHPELFEADGPERSTREFLAWTLTDAIDRGELAAGTDVPALVELLIALLWGVGFYAGFVGSHDDVQTVVAQLKLLLGERLWQPPR